MKVAIIGGGITGLTTAIALDRKGIDYVVFEKENSLNEVGAGIWVSVNALQVYEKLGLTGELLKLGIELEAATVADASLSPITSINQKLLKEKFGFKTLSIHRATLQNFLYTQLETNSVKFGVDIVAVTGKDFNEIVYSDGRVESFDLVIAADGINSNIRKQLFPNSDIRTTNQLCWRGVSNYTLPDGLKNSCYECWGGQIRFGFSVIGKEEVYWFAVSSVHKNTSLSKNDLISIFRHFDHTITKLLEHTPSKAIIVRPLGDLSPMKTWHKGSCILLGDAAHATTPNMGQGAAQGIEDAYYLSHLLEKFTVSKAFFQFEKIRMKRVNGIVQNSRMLGNMAHWKNGQSIRNLILRNLPERISSIQIDQTYSLKEFQ